MNFLSTSEKTNLIQVSNLQLGVIMKPPVAIKASPVLRSPLVGWVRIRRLDSRRQRAIAPPCLQAGKPHAHSRAENADGHQDRRRKKDGRSENNQGPCLPASCVQIQLKHRKRYRKGIGKQRQGCQERPGERVGVKADRAAVDYKPEHKPYPEKPHAADDQEQPQCPGPVPAELTGPGVVNRKQRKADDVNGLNADADLLGPVAHHLAGPGHDQAGRTDQHGSKDVGPAKQAVENRQVPAHGRQQLQRAAEDQDGCGQYVQAHNQVAFPVAVDITVGQHPVPFLEIVGNGRLSVKQQDVKAEHPLADRGHGQPAGGGKVQDRRWGRFLRRWNGSWACHGKTGDRVCPKLQPPPGPVVGQMSNRDEWSYLRFCEFGSVCRRSLLRCRWVIPR